MIQDILPHIYHNEYTGQTPLDEDIVFSFDDQEILMKPDGDFFRFRDVNTSSNMIYLFRIDDTNCFLADLSALPHSRQPLRAMRTFKPRHLAYCAVTAWQLYLWYRDTQFCGRCGNRMIHSEKERAMVCPDCGNTVYPRIMPAVIVGVLSSDDRILLTKFAGRSYTNYALISGFSEIGETIEETVRREVREETGVDVTNIRYYKCQPWPFSSTLLFGFYCDAKEAGNIVLDENELSEARWVRRDEEAVTTDDVSLTSEMIQRFRNGLVKFGE